MVNTIYLLSFVETPRKFIIAELSIRKLGSSSVLIIPLMKIISGIISTDEDPSLRIESSAIINLRGVSTKLNKYIRYIVLFQMISAEAPVLFAKAAEIFINELSLRAWVHTEDNKRRTLQRNDIAMAITKYDMFDFLIDIVPRDDLKPNKRQVNN